MLAAKSYDMVMGVDIHILIVPPGAPVPIPHPHIGMLFDPMDFIPVVGATVYVNGIPRAQAGTAGKNIPPHIPLGGSFTKPPGNESEVFMGSSTVVVDGSPFSFLGVPSISCHDIGMPAPPRAKKKSSKPVLFLPTSAVMSIPAGMPVMIGGAPTIDMMAMAMKMGLKGLGKLRKSKFMKKASDKIHNAAEAAMKKVKVPPGLRNAVHKGICFVTGHPVDVATGKVFTDGVDIELPGPVPFKWERTWYSTSEYEGSLGHGWHHSYDMALCVDKDKQAVALRMTDGRPAAFDFVAPGEEYFNRKEKLTILRDEKGWGIRNKERQVYRFEAASSDPDIFSLSSIEDADNHAIQFSYDLHGHLNQIIDSGGRVLDVICNINGRIQEIRTASLPNNYKLVSYHYDTNNDLLEVRDALDIPMTYAYSNHLLVKETNRNGLSFYFEYDRNDHQAKCVHTWGDGGIYDHKIAYKEGITEVVNSLGYKTMYVLDGQGLVSQVIDANGNSSYTEYSTDLDLVKETDAAGLSTGYLYDEKGNQIAVVMPDGATYSKEYNNDDLLISATDPVGATTIWQYDENRRLVTKIDSTGKVLQFTYKNGFIETVRDIVSGETKFDYDKAGNLSMMQLPEGGIHHWRYDAMGNMTMSADPKGNTQQLVFDKRTNVVQVNEPDGNTRFLQYDGEENLISAKDNQHEVQFEYGGMSRLRARIENNTRVDFIYDQEENLAGIKNEKGFAYNFKLDPVGDVLEEIGFDGVTRRYQRDGSGKVLKIFRQGGIITEFKYDDGGRIELVDYSDGSREQYAYRQDGEIMLAQNDFITVEFERDINGNVIAETQGRHQVSSVYDEKGLRTKINSTLGADIFIERDRTGEVINTSASNGKANWQAGFTRDMLGQEIERSLPGGLRSKWERDRLGRPLRHTISKQDGRISDKTYRWNVNDRLQGIVNEIKGVTTSFGHDAFGNLASAQYEDGKYDYRMPDAVGNLFRTKEQNDRKYGPAGQLLEANGTQYFYDAEGNLIRKVVSKVSPGDSGLIGNWEYKWYANAMLKEALRPDGEKVTFIYDALGRRIAKTFKGNTTKWVWDGNVPFHEWTEEASDIPFKEEEATLKVDDAGQLKAQTAWHAKLLQPVITWLFEADSFVPMGKLVGNTNYSIITDHIGTPLSMHDDEGNSVWTAEYDIYGKVKNLNGRLSACPFRYQGQYEDVETGLFYNRFRYYDPDSGTYISQDPILLHGGLECYNYVLDPATWVDRFGLVGDDTLEVGPFASDSIPARSTARDWTKEEVDKINEIGKTKGCHTCGSKISGTKSGNFIPDHQPPSALLKNGKSQRLYPHCLTCSNRQGGQVGAAKRKANCKAK